MSDIDDQALSARIAINAPIAACVTQAAGILAEGGVNEPRASARRLVAAACNLSPSAMLARESKAISGEARELLLGYLRRRLSHEPVSKILGQSSFWKSEFLVSQAVLDPRPDTELLIEIAVEKLAHRRHEPLRILDLGTGSGAILCALLQEFPTSTGSGVDISADACAIANENIERHGLAKRAEIICGDWTDLSEDEPWDIIVSNPPYIATGAIAGLSPDVRDWDPRVALDGGNDGLDAYRSLGPLIRARLAENGLALLEIGFDQAESVPEVMAGFGLTVEAVNRDLGGNPRVVVVKK